MIEDMSDLVDEFGAPQVVRRPRTAASYDSKGRLVPAAATDDLEVVAVVLPLSGEETQQLPAGDIAEDVRVVFSKEQLRAADAAAGTQADLLVLEEGDFEVQKAEPWGELAGVWKAVAVRVNRLPGDA